MAQSESRIGRALTILVLADPGTSAANKYAGRTNSRGPVQVWLATTGPNADETAELAKELKLEVDGPLSLVAVDGNGQVKATLPAAKFVADDEIDWPIIDAFISEQTAQIPDAQELLEDALNRAGQQDKRVLIQHQDRGHTSLLVSHWLERHREAIEKDYVWLGIDSQWPGGDAVLRKLRGEGRLRTPWLGVVDPEGNLQTSLSDIPGTRDSRFYRMANIYEKFLRPIARKMDELDIDLMIDDIRNP